MPEIPPNTGNIGRLCVNSNTSLSIIGEPAFDISEKAVRRAGLDYWEHLQWEKHDNWADYLEKRQGRKIYLVSKFGTRNYARVDYQPNDILVFGRETTGLPEEIRNSHNPLDILRIPMAPISRSINLSNSVAIVLFEALRQIHNWSENTLPENSSLVI